MTYEEMSAENDRKQLIRDERRKDHKWYYQKNKEKYKERSLAYYYAHREDRIKKVRDRYNAMSPEAKKEMNHRYYENMMAKPGRKEKEQQEHKRYYQEHREEILAKSKQKREMERNAKHSN